MNHLTKSNSKLTTQIHEVSEKTPKNVCVQIDFVLYNILFWRLLLSTVFLSLIMQIEDNWEQEKKIRAEVEKARRKAEGDLKMTIENLNEMERSKIDLEEVVKKYVCF